MNCEILETLYIKSNGDIPCNDDRGEAVMLGQVEMGNPNWDISKIFENGQFQQIRDHLSNDLIPWENICNQCAFFRPSENYRDPIKKKKIKKLQIEPSLACNLACPCCLNLRQIKTRPKPHIMKIEIFEKVISSLKENKFSVQEIEYCGQGEPLMHPDFNKFIRVARDNFPHTRQRLITNGNFDYYAKLSGEFIDEIYVSCDGATQESYEKYRIKGNVNQALNFLRNVPSYVDGKKQIKIWKYILFEFNDSEQELKKAQELAQEYNVDTLLFVFTHSLYKSQKYTLENASELPILFQNVKHNGHPSLHQYVLNATRVKTLSYYFNKKISSTKFEIDQVELFKNQYLSIKGWALSKIEISHLQFKIDGKIVGHARLEIPRADVLSVHRSYDNLTCGFIFSSKISSALSGRKTIEVCAYGNSDVIGKTTFSFNFSR